jgi:hypothetical protein
MIPRAKWQAEASFLLKWAFCESIIGLFNYGPLQMEMAWV